MVVTDTARYVSPADPGVINVVNALPQVVAPAPAAPIVTYLGGYRVPYPGGGRDRRGGGGAGGADHRGGLTRRSDRHRAPASRAVQTLG
ncbi:hypothetical protein GCM10010384_54830 [Streptomyces djakartensis]|uniref:Uncharacterized protein n=1 Tax=Streptomyces djakartensis TaxID=68193 RepID=A0ABQ3ABM3_9ACTN|nr:hypothetical protein GCM10010384_54830 [Streptomyces djakartensis]